MGAKDRRGWVALAAAAGFFAANLGVAYAQTRGNGKATTKKAEDDDQIRVVEKRVPVHPTDAVALVNGEPITRQSLSDEAIIREGERVLEAMISKKLVEQEVRKKGLQITSMEVDKEIERVAATFGLSREKWLASLFKERKISPSSYANDIIYPTLALRKLAEPRVVITPEDMKDAYDAYFGEKLKCRIIMLADQKNAAAVWNELQKNPGSFAYVAQNDRRSIDESTKSMGGLLEQPLTRHAYPREVSDAAFAQLVDGDPKDKDPSHKPKNGTMTGPIQVHESAWVIFKRENLSEAQIYDPKDEGMRLKLRELIYEAKVKEEQTNIMNEVFAAAAIENRLTGLVKEAHEEKHPDHKVETPPKLMSEKASQANPRVLPPPSGTTKVQKVGASAVKPEDRATRDEILKTIGKPDAPTSPNPPGTPK